MKNFFYDLHIHSCLSPCADDDMTPCNIAGMAKLCGLDAIAVTDHNTCRQVRAVTAASQAVGGPLVVPGMELETSEAIHLIVLFPTVESCERFERAVWRDTMRVKNRPEIFGRQIVMNERDQTVTERQDLLIVSSAITLEKARDAAKELGGVAVPAHIDKPSNGLIGVLGALTDDMGFHAVELSSRCDAAFERQIGGQGYRILRNSDAHTLGDISERENSIRLDRLSADGIIRSLQHRIRKLNI